MTKRWMDESGIGFVDAQCCYCNKRLGTIWYDIKSGYKPFCDFCAEHLALGMLRDCVEVRFGRGRANAWYMQLQNSLLRMRNKIADVGLEVMKKCATPTEKIVRAMMEKPRCISDKMLQKEFAREAGCTLKDLGKVMDLSRIRLIGQGIQCIEVGFGTEPIQ